MCGGGEDVDVVGTGDGDGDGEDDDANEGGGCDCGGVWKPVTPAMMNNGSKVNNV